MGKEVFGTYVNSTGPVRVWTAKAQISCTSMQSDQGLHCPQTESLDTIEFFTGEQMLLMRVYACAGLF